MGKVIEMFPAPDEGSVSPYTQEERKADLMRIVEQSFGDGTRYVLPVELKLVGGEHDSSSEKDKQL